MLDAIDSNYLFGFGVNIRPKVKAMDSCVVRFDLVASNLESKDDCS